MKRFHVHVAVKNLDESIGFYKALFGAEPSLVKPGYAKWLLDEPALNFAITAGSTSPGLRHLGLQVDTDADLENIDHRLNEAGHETQEETGARCCYAVGNKRWVRDPSGIAWEEFHSLGLIDEYGQEPVAQTSCGPTDSGAHPGAGQSCCR